MKWTAVLVSALVLGGCVSRSIPNLEDVSPAAQASTAPGTMADGRTKPNLEDAPPTAEASPKTMVDAGRTKPNLEDVPPTAQASDPGRAVEPPADQRSALTPGITGEAAQPRRGVELTAQQRSDIERGVRRGLAGPNPARFGPMAATVSKVTSKSYIVCGWVEAGEGYRPFLAMYVPYMRTALLVAVAGKQPEELVRQRCVDEGVRLPS